jgi:4,5-DOPA dioxygenase extradiol
MDRPRTIHDFGGFPRALFEVQYPAAGDPRLAERVRERLAPVEIQMDHSWGLDHGSWSVLAHLFPEADVPVVQLSLDVNRSPREHYELATRLAPLREAGVLILGSGNVVHNLGLMRWDGDAEPYDWAVRFNTRVRDCLGARQHEPLVDYAAHAEAANRPSVARGPRFDSIGEDAHRSVPTPEHYLPLLYVIAQQRPDEQLSLPVDGIEYGSIGMLSVAVGLETA